MKKQRLPRGWTQQRIRELAEHHERLSEEEQAEEIEISMSQRGRTVMVVPTRLVPKILELMAPKRTA